MPPGTMRLEFCERQTRAETLQTLSTMVHGLLAEAEDVALLDEERLEEDAEAGLVHALAAVDVGVLLEELAVLLEVRGSELRAVRGRRLAEGEVAGLEEGNGAVGDAGLPDEAEVVGDDGFGLGVAPLPQILPRGHGAQRRGGVAAAANSIHVVHKNKQFTKRDLAGVCCS